MRYNYLTGKPSSNTPNEKNSSTAEEFEYHFLNQFYVYERNLMDSWYQ